MKRHDIAVECQNVDASFAYDSVEDQKYVKFIHYLND